MGESKYTRDGDVAIVTINNPPVNALSAATRQAIHGAILEAAADSTVRAIVVIGAGNTFAAGADINEFDEMRQGSGPRPNFLQPLIETEDTAVPVIMAIHGTAFGLGLEFAMAGHYRVAVRSAQLGQPEVKLGLIPGAAGTQRLPRLVGVAKALEMCVGGDPVKAPEALQIGLIDRIIDDDLLPGAIAFAREVAGQPFRKTRERTDKLTGVDPTLFAAARANAAKTKRGQAAPLKAIEAIEAAATLPFDVGCQAEARLFDECLNSNEAKALIYAFFGERTVAKIPGISGISGAPKLFDIRHAAVIGAGTMGGGIAMNFANAGIPVIVREQNQDALDRGISKIRELYAASVKKGRYSQAVADQRMAMITPQLTWAGFERADLIIEAVFESMAVKKSVFAELEKIAKPDCILATNTSTLNIDEIASVTSRPHMVIGLHFFSPANVMRLLEIVRGKATGNETIATAMALAKKLGKVGVLAGNAHGFIGNRMLEPYVREAEFLVEEGASVEDVNDAIYDFGLPMGPLAMSDMAGLDILWHMKKEHQHLAKPGVREDFRVGSLICERGHFGQKTGRGWSLYDQNRRPSPDPEVAALIEQVAKEAGIERRTITRGEIVDRCIYALVNEGARVLEEGVALRAVDIDIVYLTGYGFPAWRGGPMFYADTVGLKKVLARIEEFEKRHGPELWAPAPLLRRLAEAGETFSSVR